MASVSVAHGFPHGGEKEFYADSPTSVDPTSGSYWAITVAAFKGLFLDSYQTLDYGVDVPPTGRSWWMPEFAVGPFESADQDQEFHIFGNGTVEIRGKFENADPPTYYTVRFYDSGGLVGEGSTQFAAGASPPNPGDWHTSRVTWLSGQTALEVDGVFEVNAATAAAIPALGPYYFGGDVGGFSSTVIFLRKVVAVRGDGGADRPDETSQLFAAVEIGGNGSYTAWTGVFTDYNDWNGGGPNNGDTDYINTPDAVTRKETATLVAQPTITGAYEHALMTHHRARITGSPGGSKHLGDSLIHDGVSDNALTLGGSTNTNWRSKACMFKFAPDGNAWDAAGAAALEIGVRGASTGAPTGVRHTAIAGEWCKYALDAGDPPAIAAAPRNWVTVIG